MADVVPCPDLAQYQRLAAGLLPDAEREPLLSHLERCDACARRLSTLPESETLASLIRQAETHADRPAEAAVARLVERLCQLRPAGQGPPLPRATVTHQPAASGDQAAYDFLAPPEAPGELGRLGAYHVLEVLGKGGMGVVFRALDPRLERLVALKAMLPALAAEANFRERFLREGRAAAAVKHDHIVAVYQVDEDRGVPFLAMEFLEGEPLSARLQREGKLAPAEVLHIGREVALGLAAAHKRGLIHRDIKPANVWLEAVGESGTSGTRERAKILDFGLARPAAQEGQLTQPGAILGTPAYMAPEQGQGKRVDARSDLFSLGCMLYRMATGQPAFKGTDLISILLAVASENPRPPRELESSVPPGLSDLILRLLAKEPADRPASALAVAEELQGIARSLHEPGPESATPRPAARRRWPLVVGAVGLAVAAGLAALSAGGIFRVRTPDGTIVLEDVPENAQVLVDGGEVMVTTKDGTSFDIRVAPGKKHRLQVEKEGFKVFAQDIEIDAGGRQPLRVHLEPLAAAPAAPTKDRTGPQPVRPPLPSAALEALRADRIPAEVLAAAGDGDPKKAPAGLVAVLGDASPVHTAPISQTVFSPDGRWLATVGQGEKTVILWDAATCWAVRVIREQQDVFCVAFGKDSRTLVTGAQDGTITLWPLDSDKATHTFRAWDVNSLRPITVSPDGRFLATASQTGPKIWKWGQWDKPSVTITPPGVFSRAMAFTPDGEMVAVGCNVNPRTRRTIRLFRTADGQGTATLEGIPAIPWFMAISGDGKVLASSGGGGNDTVEVWDLASQKSVATFEHRQTEVYAIALSPDGKTLAVALSEGVAIYDVASRTRKKGTDALAGQGQRALAFSPDGKRLVVGGGYGLLLWYDTADWKPTAAVSRRGHLHTITAVAISPDGRTVLSGSSDGTLRRWDLERPGANEVVGRLSDNRARVKFNPDGRTFATLDHKLIPGQLDTVTVWEAATGRERFQVPRTCWAFTYSPDGKILATSGQDRTITLWDASDGRELDALDVKLNVIDLAFSPDSKLLAATEPPGVGGSKVWNREAWTDVCSCKGYACTIAFSPAGKLFAIGQVSGFIEIWDLGTRKRIWTLRGHTGPVRWLRFTADGKTLVSSSDDGTVRLWDPDPARARQVIEVGPRRQVMAPLALDLDRSGKYVVVSCRRALFVLRLPLGGETKRAAD